MKVVTAAAPLLKMEDRKRSAGHNIDDIAPPTKRQAVNGSKASADADMPWKEFIEVSSCAQLSIEQPYDPPVWRLPPYEYLCRKCATVTLKTT